MILTIIGLPLMVLTIGVLANLLVHIVLFLLDISGLKCVIEKTSSDQQQLRYLGEISELGKLKLPSVDKKKTYKHTVIICLISVAVLLIATILFSQDENWALFDSFYFTFITFSTIGICYFFSVSILYDFITFDQL